MLRMIQMVAGMAMLSLAMGCGSSSPIPGVPLPSLVNGSFETGDFTGWVTQDLTDPLAPLAVGPSGATDGVSGVQTGFDGNGGPGNDSIFVAQDVDLTGIASAAVRFDWAVPFCDVDLAGLDRVFSLVIEPAGGGTPLFSQAIHTCPGGAFTLGGPVDNAVIDISSVAGQPIRIKFLWFVPEDFTGPAEAFLDDVVLIDPLVP